MLRLRGLSDLHRYKAMRQIQRETSYRTSIIQSPICSHQGLVASSIKVQARRSSGFPFKCNPSSSVCRILIFLLLCN
ncbi:hypothetical protein RB195_005590 [Necator americanus]|uniref:Uncharacterized protein n=1 Tax=Necator americanus TaxID=51031 RepID=A0ABR1BNM0_NECAM